MKESWVVKKWIPCLRGRERKRDPMRDKKHKGRSSQHEHYREATSHTVIWRLQLKFKIFLSVHCQWQIHVMSSKDGTFIVQSENTRKEEARQSRADSWQHFISISPSASHFFCFSFLSLFLFSNFFWMDFVKLSHNHGSSN